MDKQIHDKKDYWNSSNRNFSTQFYKGVPLEQIDRGYGKAKARRFTINNTNQNVWIPCRHLEPDGTIKPGAVIDYVFAQSVRQLELAGFEIKYEEIKKAPSAKGAIPKLSPKV